MTTVGDFNPGPAVTSTANLVAGLSATSVPVPIPLDVSAATYAAARLLSGVTTGDRLQLLGRTSQSDGGQGLFTWVAGGTTTINDGTQLTATGGIWQRTPDQLTNPLMFGAAGDGVTDDTTAVQAAVNTGYCLLTPGKFFKVTSPIKVIGNKTTLVGAGFTSVLRGVGVVGAVVQVGDGSTQTGYNVVEKFRVYGSATTGISVNNVQPELVLNDVAIASFAGDPGQATSFVNGFDFTNTFGSSFTNLTTNSTNIGGSVTFTASIGGATTGTLTVAITNGTYDFVFSDFEMRSVTITGGTTATWSIALSAGTITTANYGSCFRAQGSFNANFSANWYTNNLSTAFAFNFGDNGGQGNTYDILTAQGPVVGFYVGGSHVSSTFNSPYNEAVTIPFIIGNQIVGGGSNFPSNLTFNSPIGQFVLDSVQGIVINTPQLGDFNRANDAPLTFSGGGATTQATGVGLVNTAGVIKAVVVTSPGAGYTSNPSVAVGGSGSSGAVTAVQAGGIITTANLTLTNGGSGYSHGLMPIYYNNADNVVINNPWSRSNGAQGQLWAFVIRGPNSNAQGITIINDSAQIYAGNTKTVSANLTPANNPGGFGSAHWLTYLTGTGPQGTNPTPTYVLVVPPTGVFP